VEHVLDFCNANKVYIGRSVYLAAGAAYAKRGDIVAVAGIVAEMREKRMNADLKFFTALIQAFLASRDLKSALAVYEEMKSMGLKADLTLFNTLLKYGAETKDQSVYAHVDRLFEEVRVVCGYVYRGDVLLSYT
jgi:pentatricopeptide repeat protein